MARVSALTSSGVLRIWYFMCTALVLMKVWMRGTSACLTASQQTRTSFSMARASPQTRGPFDLSGDRLDRLEVVRRGDREPGLDDVDAQLGELPRDLELLGPVHARAGRLLAVAQRGVEDPDVTGGAHECLTSPVTARVAVRKIGASVPDRKVAQWAGRCLRIPPEGEQEQAAEELEVAGAYLNVGLQAGLACHIVTHGPVSVRQARTQAQGAGAEARRAAGRAHPRAVHVRRGAVHAARRAGPRSDSPPRSLVPAEGSRTRASSTLRAFAQPAAPSPWRATEVHRQGVGAGLKPATT